MANKLQCQICDKLFKSQQGISGHITNKQSHNISLKQYYDLFFKNHNEDICKNSNCDNITKFISLKKGYRDFCGYSCSNKTILRNHKISKKQKEEHSKFIKNLWDEENSIYRSKKVKEQKRSKMLKQWNDSNSKLNNDERNKKISEKQKIAWSNKDYKQFHSELMIKKRKDPNSIYNDKNYIKKQKASYNQNVRNRMSKNSIQAWENPDNKLGDNNWRKNRSEYMKNGGAKHAQSFIDKEKQKETASERMLNGGAAYCNSFVTNPSKPQVELYKLTQTIFPYPIMNYPYLNKSIDIAIPSLGLAIEYDGSYWHQDKEKDKKRQKLLEDDGWIFIRYVDYIPSQKEFLYDYNNLIG